MTLIPYSPIYLPPSVIPKSLSLLLTSAGERKVLKEEEEEKKHKILFIITPPYVMQTDLFKPLYTLPLPSPILLPLPTTVKYSPSPLYHSERPFITSALSLAPPPAPWTSLTNKICPTPRISPDELARRTSNACYLFVRHFFAYFFPSSPSVIFAITWYTPNRGSEFCDNLN